MPGYRVGLDYAVSSKVDTNITGSNHTIDCTSYILNGEYLIDNFKLGVNWASLKPTDGDETFAELSGGYHITNNIFTTLTYYKQDWNGQNTGGTTTANMVGVEALFPVNDKLSIGGNLGYSLLGASCSGSEFSSYIDPKVTVTQYGLKVKYQVSDSINVNLKYRVDDSHFTCSGVLIPGRPTVVDDIYTWITLGVSYSF
jgi:Outer membrane protein beta-barrel domain